MLHALAVKETSRNNNNNHGLNLKNIHTNTENYTKRHGLDILLDILFWDPETDSHFLFMLLLINEEQGKRWKKCHLLVLGGAETEAKGGIPRRCATFYEQQHDEGREKKKRKKARCNIKGSEILKK